MAELQALFSRSVGVVTSKPLYNLIKSSGSIIIVMIHFSFPTCLQIVTNSSKQKFAFLNSTSLMFQPISDSLRRDSPYLRALKAVNLYNSPSVFLAPTYSFLNVSPSSLSKVCECHLLFAKGRKGGNCCFRYINCVFLKFRLRHFFQLTVYGFKKRLDALFPTFFILCYV